MAKGKAQRKQTEPEPKAAEPEPKKGGKVQVLDPAAEDVLPGDSVSQVGLTPQLLKSHLEHQTSQSEVSRVQTYPNAPSVDKHR